MTTLTSTTTLIAHVGITGWNIGATFDTEAQANAFVSRYPKSAGLKVHGTNAIARAALQEDGVNGGVNEAGLRRYRSLTRRADKLGTKIEFRGMSREEFEAELGM